MPDEPPTASANRELAVEVVSAYLRRNQVRADQLPSLLSTVHRALADLGKPAEEALVGRNPAVSIRRSITANFVVCLDCGWKGQMLRRHLTTAHGLTVDEYRARWKLPRDHAMTAPAYSQRRSTMATQIGLGRSKGASAEPVAVSATAPQPSPKRRGRPRSKATPTVPV
jgi:predicted transcriptional regulator